MTMHRPLLVASFVAVAGLSALSAAPARAAESLGGSPVAGVCLLSRGAVFEQSKVGQSASERLKQLATQGNSQLESQRKPIDADIQSFQQKAESLTEAQRKEQGAALQQRMQGFQAQAGQMNQRIQLTRAKIMQNIGQQAEPIVSSTYKSHKCGLLLDRDSVLGGNMTNDLTGDVVKGLDAKITTLNFGLEPLPAAGK